METLQFVQHFTNLNKKWLIRQSERDTSVIKHSQKIKLLILTGGGWKEDVEDNEETVSCRKWKVSFINSFQYRHFFS